MASSRESMMLEHRSLLQSIAQQKQDLAVQEAKMNVHQRLATTRAVLKSETVVCVLCKYCTVQCTAQAMNFKSGHLVSCMTHIIPQ